MARTVRDVGMALTIMAGPDGLDPYAMPVPVQELEDVNAPPVGLAGLRVGWCADGPFAPVTAEVRETVTRAATALAELGCRVEPVSLASWDQWPPQNVSMSIFTAEGGHYLEPVISGREDQLAPSMQRRLSLPTPALREYLEALAGCESLRQDVARYFTEYDVLLCPTGPLTAHPHDSTELDVDGQRVPGRNALRATIPFDLTGSPAMSVPFGWSAEGLPIGVQLVGRHFDEATLLRVGSRLEGLGNTEGRRPPV
jgi:aspartyl-tRNA(Asn)/glutamyl-tRNA(Gln) amidotransferase subunit A